MDANTQAVINTLAAQRNQALDTIAQQNGHIADLQARIAELTAKPIEQSPEDK